MPTSTHAAALAMVRGGARQSGKVEDQRCRLPQPAQGCEGTGEAWRCAGNWMPGVSTICAFSRQTRRTWRGKNGRLVRQIAKADRERDPVEKLARRLVAELNDETDGRHMWIMLAVLERRMHVS